MGRADSGAWSVQAGFPYRCGLYARRTKRICRRCWKIAVRRVCPSVLPRAVASVRDPPASNFLRLIAWNMSRRHVPRWTPPGDYVRRRPRPRPAAA